MNRRSFLAAAAVLPWSPSIMSCCGPSYVGASPYPPGLAYYVGASYEYCGINWGCADGPRVAQILGGLLADRNIALATDGFGGALFDDFEEWINVRQALRVAEGATGKKIAAAVLGITGDAVNDTAQLDYVRCAGFVAQMLEWTDNVFVLDYPPFEGRHVPYFTELNNVDPVWWDTIWRPGYRAAMQTAGAKVICPFYDWEPYGIVLPHTAPYPDYHINSPSARRAAYRIYTAIISAL
ncbi:MAG: hypothetical protein HC888_02810 [Candidatus Competibacteraceae bacterium]|nr:hypothetical protein [Candidatus Competibacteraceae bacterium]